MTGKLDNILTALKVYRYKTEDIAKVLVYLVDQMTSSGGTAFA
jgi:hypothetical protein